MESTLSKLIKENPDLPVFAWVDWEVVQDDCRRWIGEFNGASVEEYVRVDDFEYLVFKDDYEDYLQHRVDCDLDDKTEEELEKEIQNLDYKKAIFVYVDLPDNL